MNPRCAVSWIDSQKADDHLHRLLQSSESSIQHNVDQQLTKLLPSQRHANAPLPNGGLPESLWPHITSMTRTLDLSKQYAERDQPIATCPVMRGKIFPISPPCSIIGIGNVNLNADIAQFFPQSTVSDVKERSMQLDPSYGSLTTTDHRKSEASTGNRKTNQKKDFGESLPLQLNFSRETLSEMSMMNPEQVLHLRRVQESLEHMEHTVSGYSQKNAFLHMNASTGSSSAPAQTAITVKDGLQRHSGRTPAHLQSQLYEKHERRHMDYSSGRSSEDGDYEIQGIYRYLNKHSCAEDRDNMNHVARRSKKRTRDSSAHSASSVLLDNQKKDPFDDGVFSDYPSSQSSGIKENNMITMGNMQSNSVPCRERAKRGCATHPRSIAERVRRTKISERIKKLQELMPNIDKQANIAEMLDEAVEYVRSLQRQVQMGGNTYARMSRP
ncbi:hypothetical protein KP509_04G045500 [Ceratopteris richardii]|uniref:BHLH domain-containing protein n=1 Tax=Ceratopteris richardii TaxID=49495 RepID=A0A8T2V043_CERRI|nr:hypothetical protein KP509_04G045500 [Ceratopteris richardii]